VLSSLTFATSGSGRAMVMLATPEVACWPMRPRLQEDDQYTMALLVQRSLLPRITTAASRITWDRCLWGSKELMLAARSHMILCRGDDGSTVIRLLLERDSKSIDSRDLGIVIAANRPKPPAHTSRSHRIIPWGRYGFSVQYNIWFHLARKSWIYVAASSNCP
jgi:hypothetical protein